MDEKKTTDLSYEIRKIYHQERTRRLPITESHVPLAVTTVNRLFPPHTPSEAFCILASLNLLNAAIKLPWGKGLVTYRYIKGMAARLFVYLTYHPIQQVCIYYDRAGDVAYFSVFGVQISFHHLPWYKSLREALYARRQQKQQWDGLRLQRIPIELYNIAHHMEARTDTKEQIPPPTPRTIIRTSAHEETPNSLKLALRFSLRTCHQETLFRRRDNKPVRVIRYNGHNYCSLISFLAGSNPFIAHRDRKTLEAGKLYHLSGCLRIRTIAPSNQLLFAAQNNYLIRNNKQHNLCVTYGIARYLACLYPELRFVCTLNYSRVRCRRRYYTWRALKRIPLHSESRRLKTWLVVDPLGVLQNFNLESLPQSLVSDYLKADDYYQPFEITTLHGRKGIRAYRRHHLLLPVYAQIRIHNFHAYVKRDDGKWAIYSLRGERFYSDFCYDRIWFSPHSYTIYGSIDGEQTKIFEFFPSEKEVSGIPK